MRHLAAWTLLALLLSCSTKAEQALDPAYMRLGENALAPFALTQFCVRKPARCSPAEEVKQVTLDVQRSEIERVNREVNRTFVPIMDGAGLEKSWDDEAMTGDCHDYVLAKRSRLLDLGYPSSALLLAIAIVPSGRGHLVLVVVTDKGDFVLDNLRPSLVRWDKLPYRWIKRSMPKNPQYWQTILPPVSLVEDETGSVPETDQSGDSQATDTLATRICN